MTFSEKMIAKYGEARWEEMKAKAEASRNEPKVEITFRDMLNHSVAQYVMTGDSNSNALPEVKHTSRVVSSRPMTATERLTAGYVSRKPVVGENRVTYGKTIPL